MALDFDESSLSQRPPVDWGGCTSVGCHRDQCPGYGSLECQQLRGMVGRERKRVLGKTTNSLECC